MIRCILLGVLCLASCSVFSQGTWSFEDIAIGAKPSIAVGVQDMVLIAYMQEADQGIVGFWGRRGDEVFHDTVRTGYFYGPLDVGMGPFGTAHIVYHDHDWADLARAHSTDFDNWTIDRLSSEGHDGWDGSLITDGQGHVHVAFTDPGTFLVEGVQYGYFDGTDWTLESTGSNLVEYANGTCIALDPAGQAHITYYDNQSQQLKLASRTESGWLIATIDAEAQSGRFASLRFDGNGGLHIGYHRDLGNDRGAVMHAYNVGNGWVIDAVDTLENVELSFLGARNVTDIVIDDNNDIHMSYCDKNVLKYARKSIDGDWQISTVYEVADGNLPLGQQSSIAIDSEGRLYIVYYEVTQTSPLNGQIKLARSDFSTDIQEIPNDIAFRVRPNPTQGYFTLDMDDKHTIRLVELFDIEGRRLGQWQSNGPSQVYHVEPTLPSGLYFIRVKSESASGVQRLIVE